MANDEEWQRQHDERHAELAAQEDMDTLEAAAAAGDQAAKAARQEIVNISINASVTIRQSWLSIRLKGARLDEPGTPSTALINLLFSPKRAKDIKANLGEVYMDIWVPENGPRWATFFWYTHTAAYFVGSAIAPLLDVLERVKKLVSFRT